MDSTPWIEKFFAVLATWSQSLLSPKEFVAPAFHPEHSQIVEGLEFVIAMMLGALILYLPLALTEKGDFAEKAKLATNATLGVISSAACAMSLHFAFWMLGGEASFAGTYLAYAYGMGPYLPLIAFATLLMVSGLAPPFRRPALNPFTAQTAMKSGIEDPHTSRGVVLIGSLAMLGLLGWSIIVFFRSLSLVHSITGWALGGAVLVSLVLMAPVGFVFKRMATLVVDPAPTET